MKKLELFVSLITSLTVILSGSGCSEDEGPSNIGIVNLTVSGNGTGTVNTGGRIGGRQQAAVIIEDFQISIRDVIFKTDVDDDSVSDDSTEVLFRGPYALDLMSETGALEQTIGDAEVPLGVYEELRFKLHKSKDLATTHPLYNRSIYIKGTIDNMPFVMWHDTGENLDAGKSTGVTVDENGVSITVKFSVDQFFNGIDISGAKDRDGDGVIEINPDNDDENEDYADELKENIKEAADLLDN